MHVCNLLFNVNLHMCKIQRLTKNWAYAQNMRNTNIYILHRCKAGTTTEVKMIAAKARKGGSQLAMDNERD